MKSDAGRSLQELQYPGWFCNVASVPDCKELTWDWPRWWYLTSIECLRDIVNLPSVIYEENWYFCIVNPWQNLSAGVLTFLREGDRLLAKITRPEHIKITTNTLHRYYWDTTDIPLSNSYYKKRKYIYNTFFNWFFNTNCIRRYKKGTLIRCPSVSLTHRKLSSLTSYLGQEIT